MFLRTILFSTLMLFCCGATLAQTPEPQFWRNLTCEPFEPRTFLEQVENSGGLVLKGFTRITTVDVRGIRVDAIEMRAFINPNNTRVVKGLVVALREGGERPNEDRAFVDYNEIEYL